MPDTDLPDDTPYSRYRATRFFGSLNGLRFVCIIAVMWHHSPVRGAWPDAPLALLRGFVGVDFFFVLSGFLITTLLLREEDREGRFSLRGFYWRRILRIVPVYFFVVTVVSAYFILVKGQGALVPLVPYYYLFLSNMLVEDIPLLTITWSLAVEEQYYMIWPLLLLLVPARAGRGRARIWMLLGLIAGCIAVATGMIGQGGGLRTEHALWRLPATGYSAILIGALLAVVLHMPSGFAGLYRLLGHRVAPVVLFVALGAVLQFIPGMLEGWPNVVMHSVMALCLASIVLREDHLLAGVFSWRLPARIGEISYGLYLYHMIGRHFGVEIGARLGLPSALEPWAQTLLFAVISILIAEVSFRSLEAAFLRLKGRSRPIGEGEGASRPS
ncbi:peptidoglycan/LPS O-acetylase OafA/YrhL [Litoreibacter meonggei]|uniref:Peptidoglycan/LPS O-acetylase OafA/YrhL n=1 Tax=Litoreibacter meonggei TaxID=1049199 RepID=A0A497VHM4_9RHOB|nr:acyltransferase [Litoreibacter meonggei]RLJ36183.1 peptidoglycan/LPS O-acetylase OafA/YrhL [Litoreibacter meonggei]